MRPSFFSQPVVNSENMDKLSSSTISICTYQLDCSCGTSYIGCNPTCNPATVTEVLSANKGRWFDTGLATLSHGEQPCQKNANQNEEEQWFTNLCPCNKVVMCGIIFHHISIHKATWISPDHTTENQVDHICITKSPLRDLGRKKRWHSLSSPRDGYQEETEAKYTLDNWENRSTKV